MGKRRIRDNGDKSGWLYVLDSNIEPLKDNEMRPYKIGRSRVLSARMGKLDTLYAYRTSIAYTYHVRDQFQEEDNLHFIFSERRMNGEWFMLGLDDLGLIAAEFGQHNGFFELADGRIIADPLRPRLPDDDAIERAICELEGIGSQLARQIKYLPLCRFADTPCDMFDMEENGIPDAWQEEEQEEEEPEEPEERYEESFFEEETTEAF